MASFYGATHNNDDRPGLCGYAEIYGKKILCSSTIYFILGISLNLMLYEGHMDIHFDMAMRDFYSIVLGTDF